MLRSVKNIFWLLAIVAGAQSALGFALIGPPVPSGSDAYQIQDIGYNVGGGEQGTPRLIKEEYRRNTPVVYYAYDESFWEYFNTNGVQEIDKAFAIYNRVGKYSQLDINDYPEDSRRVNFQAQAMGLFDLRSFILGLMTQELGLFEPSRWVWNITGRAVSTTCPIGNVYTIDKRNYSITPVGTDTYPSTSYVNGVLYSYFINEICSQPGEPKADAIEFPVDPLSSPYSAVADFSSLNYSGLLPGSFYTSLTRDDVAGLKYLYNTNNLNNEAAGGRVTEFVTNDVTQAQIIQTQDLGVLAAAAKTNNAAALQALFPGLIVTSTSNYFGFQITTNITQALVNSPFDPAGVAPSHPIFSTNYTTNVVNFFVHGFGNVVTNTFGTRGLVGVITVGISVPPLSPAGTIPTTNTTVALTSVPGVFGDFFILPTNTCAAEIISNMLPVVTPVTNLPVQAPGPTTNSVTFTPGTVNFLTNHTVLYLPVTCPVDAIGTRGGSDQVIFVRRDYDSLTGQLWDPITNDYVLPELDITNSTISLRHFQRRVPRPDFLFTTANFSADSVTVTYSNTVDNTSETFTLTVTGVGESLGFNTFAYDQTAISGNKAGPGTIIDDDPLPSLFILNRNFPVYANVYTGIAPTEAEQIVLNGWGSFDGTTNAPVVYPNGASLGELEALMLGPASNTPYLPSGNVGLPYSAQIAAKGGTAPYTFSLAPTSPGLPTGLNISPGGKITGTPAGPTAIYDFTMRITDSAGLFRDVQYTITLF